MSPYHETFASLEYNGFGQPPRAHFVTVKDSSRHSNVNVHG